MGEDKGEGEIESTCHLGGIVLSVAEGNEVTKNLVEGLVSISRTVIQDQESLSTLGSII